MEGREEYIKAGKILKQAVEYAKGITKKDALLIDLAENIESKIVELGGKPAFPVNLSINEVAAHATPGIDSDEKAFGLLKVDIGVHVEGYAADTAFSVDLEDEEENKKLIKVAENALAEALKVAKLNASFDTIGKAIEQEIRKEGFVPIVNLSGHGIERYNLHAGSNVPNYSSGQADVLEKGTYAIEPFSTNGSGRVRDGKMSGIYEVRGNGNVRDNFAREVGSFIAEEYGTLPFCSRWIHKKFGSRGLLALRMLEQANVLYQYPQLVEASGGKVAQAEHTILVDKELYITTQ